MVSLSTDLTTTPKCDDKNVESRYQVHVVHSVIVRDTIGIHVLSGRNNVQHTLFYGHQDDNCADDIDTDNEMINHYQ